MASRVPYVPSERFDSLLGSLAQQHESIEAVLLTFFSFLHRRTDFYVVDPRKSRPIGFGAGVAERLVQNSFHRFPFKDAGGREIRPAEDASVAFPTQKAATDISVLKPKVSVNSPAPASLVDSAPIVGSPAAKLTPQQPQPSPSCPSSGRLVARTPEGKQVPIDNGGVGPGNSYWWSQTLHDALVHVVVPPRLLAAVRGKTDIVVRVRPHSVYVAVAVPAVDVGGAPLLSASRSSGAAPLSASRSSGAAAGRTEVVLLEGPLFGRVAVDTESYGDSGVAWTWDADPTAASRRPRDVAGELPVPGDDSGGGVLTLPLDKAEPTWWRTVVQYAVAAAGAVAATAASPPWSAEVDVTRVDSTRPVEDYDADTQAAIRKIVYDQSHGVPAQATSQELAARQPG